ncbi:MAG: flagellar FlbD family protein [Vicinamibacterales bacterium]
MIALTRLNGVAVVVNVDLITWVERHPDTVVSLANGDKLFVRESPEEIVEKVVGFKRQISGLSTGARPVLSLVRGPGESS